MEEKIYEKCLMPLKGHYKALYDDRQKKTDAKRPSSITTYSHIAINHEKGHGSLNYNIVYEWVIQSINESRQ